MTEATGVTDRSSHGVGPPVESQQSCKQQSTIVAAPGLRGTQDTADLTEP